MYFHFSCFPKSRQQRRLENQFESNSQSFSASAPPCAPVSVSQSMVGVVISQILPGVILPQLSQHPRLRWANQKTDRGRIDQWEAGNSLMTVTVDATCAGRILSNTSSPRRPLGSQRWGWEKFPLGGVFTKPGLMPPSSTLPSRQNNFGVSWE